jgi:hypothetical protein
LFRPLAMPRRSRPRSARTVAVRREDGQRQADGEDDSGGRSPYQY